MHDRYTCANGHPVRPSARFCPGCGVTIAHPVDETTMREQRWLPVPVAEQPPPATVDSPAPWGRMALVLVALLLLGTAGGWAGIRLSQRSGTTGAAPTAGPSAPAPSTVDPTAAPPGRTPPPAPIPAPTTAEAAPPEPATGVGMVDTGPVASDARARSVAWTLNEYFTGINERHIARTLAVMDPAGVVDRNDPHQAEKFRLDVSTTTDSNVTLHWIRDGAAGVVEAGVTFTSRQEPRYGPNGQACTNWSLVYALSVAPQGTYAIVRSAGTSSSC